MEELAARSDEVKKLQSKERMLTEWLAQVRAAKSKKAAELLATSEHAEDGVAPIDHTSGPHSSSSSSSSGSSGLSSKTTSSGSTSAAASDSLFSTGSGAEDFD